MLTRLKCCGTSSPVARKDSLVAAGLTLGSALVLAAIMVVGNSDLTETIGLVMFPAVLAVGPQSIYLRGHSTPVRLALIAGPFVVLLLIGLVTGLALKGP